MTGVKVKPPYSGHLRDRGEVSAIRRCPLYRGFPQNREKWIPTNPYPPLCTYLVESRKDPMFKKEINRGKEILQQIIVIYKAKHESAESMAF